MVIQEHNVRFLIGRVLTLIETLGLPEKQEKSFKDLIEQEIWQTYSHGFYISSDQHTKVRLENDRMDQSLPRI